MITVADGLRICLQIAGLYGLYLTGVWIQTTFSLLIPGSIIGMLILLGLFATNIVKTAWVAQGVSLLLRHMPLLFLPVMAGAVTLGHVFQGSGAWLFIIVLVSTVLVMVVSGKITDVLIQRRETS
ncbi:CidA/LrgA family protein [Salsuginibacillus kocurii]|uniref:CidA/LrgA family protein n=1 Tax=Salsuginibacillus kocurii TaxID=427078 RepID=UPI0003829CD2|nr:CidA/LrgA family protein [Salsuginibacillus kocurii]